MIEKALVLVALPTLVILLVGVVIGRMATRQGASTLRLKAMGMELTVQLDQTINQQ